MRKIALLLCSCLLLSAPSLSIAQDNGANASVPGIIRAGLEAYRDGGPQAAIQAWIKGSAIDGSKEALSQASNLNQIQDFYGGYRSYDVISTHDLTPHVRIIYLALNFEKGPVFGKFVVFDRTPSGSWTTSISTRRKTRFCRRQRPKRRTC